MNCGARMPDAAPFIRCIDTEQYGMPCRGASYLIGTEQVCLVETGTPRAAPILLHALEHVELSYIFVTHVHLDHAGAAGALAAHHPRAIVVAHPRAIRHLHDPTRLIDGVREASPDLYPLYGDPTPVHERQLHAAEDGEAFDIGDGIVVEAIHTPGHAPHHLCFLEPTGRVLFTGDAAGNHGIPVDIPLTVPPHFDLEAALATLGRLRELRPASLAFTHFGRAHEDATALLDAYQQELIDWFSRIRRLRERRSSEDVVRMILAEAEYMALASADRYSIEMCVRGALMTLEAVDR